MGRQLLAYFSTVHQEIRLHKTLAATWLDSGRQIVHSNLSRYLIVGIVFCNWCGRIQFSNQKVLEAICFVLSIHYFSLLFMMSYFLIWLKRLVKWIYLLFLLQMSIRICLDYSYERTMTSSKFRQLHVFYLCVYCVIYLFIANISIPFRWHKICATKIDMRIHKKIRYMSYAVYMCSTYLSYLRNTIDMYAYIYIYIYIHESADCYV